MGGRPRIGITPSNQTASGEFFVSESYLRAVEAAGGEPVELDYNALDAKRTVEAVDGVLFSGGGDVEPRLYGCEREAACGRPAPLRDQMELAFFQRAFGQQMPILGICRGIQLINVAMGGTLIQDLPSRLNVNHRLSETPEAWHRVLAVPGTRLHALTQSDDFRTNSLHHQAVDALAPGLIVSARAALGDVVEAMELAAPHFLLGVQWHPERMFESDAASRRIFTAFVDACRV